MDIKTRLLPFEKMKWKGGVEKTEETIDDLPSISFHHAGDEEVPLTFSGFAAGLTKRFVLSSISKYAC